MPLLSESLQWRARARILHLRPRKSGSLYVLSDETVWNQLTDVGRVFLHTQYFGTSPAGNGMNYIALSPDAVSETASSTVLTNEIVANGLQRAIGTVTLPTGSGTSTTISKTFTATGAQVAQKAALFSASSGGTMNHVLGFTSRTLISGDQLIPLFTITTT